MPSGPMSKPRTPMEMVETLQSRVTAGARSYRMATMRYLMRPPLSLRPKYAAFLLDPDGHNVEAVCHKPQGDA